MDHHPLAVWLFFGFVAAVFRRDRRWLARWPQLGAGSLIGAAGLYILYRTWTRSVATRAADSRLLTTAIVLVSGFAVPTLLVWVRAFLRQDLPRIRRWLRREWTAVVVYSAIGFGAVASYFLFGTQLQRRGIFEMTDVMFDADAVLYQDVISGAVRRVSDVTHKHPLFPLLARSVNAPLSWVLPSGRSTLGVVSLAGGLSVTLTCFYARCVSGSLLLGGLCGTLLAASSGHVVFSAVPETYLFSAVVLVILHILAVSTSPGWRFRHQVLAAVLAAGVTASNVLLAFVCFVARRPGRRWTQAARWAATLLVVGAVLFAVQAALLPDAIVGLRIESYAQEAQFVARGVSVQQRVVHVLRGMFLESFVGCTPTVVSIRGYRGLHTGPYDSLPARLAAALWLLLLVAASLLALRTPRAQRPALWAALACLAVSALVHSVYGNEHVFLYSCTFTFFLIAVMAHGLARLPLQIAAPVLVTVIGALSWQNVLMARQILRIIDEAIVPAM